MKEKVEVVSLPKDIIIARLRSFQLCLSVYRGGGPMIMIIHDALDYHDFLNLTVHGHPRPRLALPILETCLNLMTSPYQY